MLVVHISILRVYVTARWEVLTIGGAETDCSKTISGIVGRGVCTIGIIYGLESSCPTKPKGSEGSEHHERKCIADKEL